MFKKSVVLVSAFTFMTCTSLASEKSPETVDNKVQLAGKAVEIALKSKLDAVTANYCLDIAGGNKEINIKKGLQAHTCYSYKGSLGKDQTFDDAKFAQEMLYMPVFDVCVTLAGLEKGAQVKLKKCSESDELQKLSFAEDGTIRPVSANTMCFTAAKETRFGRSKKHQIKKLSLQPCTAELVEFQTWFARTIEDAK